MKRGEIFGLLGPNGAGKTSTLECLEGLRAADGGSLSVNGLDPAREPRKLRDEIGVQLQAAGLPVVPPQDMTPAQFLEHMAVDKKVLDGQLRLVLLKRLGEAVVTADYPREILDATLRSDYAALAQSSNS